MMHNARFFRKGFGQQSSKFGAEKTEFEGVVLDSKREARRYAELIRMQQLGLIRDLERQVRYRIEIGGVKVMYPPDKRGARRQVSYTVDFQYRTRAGELVLEDVKGFDLTMGRLKRALLEAATGITVRIV